MPVETAELHVCESPPDLSAFDIPHPRPFICATTITDDLLSNVIDHVNNVEYVRWLDRAAELHCDSLGHTRQAMLTAQRMWFVGRHEVDYLAETWLGDELLIATWVRDVRRITSWRDYLIVRPSDETIVCQAATKWVFVDLNSRRPTRISDDMIRLFDPLTDHSPPAASDAGP
jgi:acyl-CoA thioester hydrolase